MRTISLLLLAITMWSSSCDTAPKEDDDMTGNLEITFKVRYDNAPLVLFEEIASGQSDPTSILFKKLEFFISNIKGGNAEGLTEFKDVGYISMANSLTTAAAEAGTTFTINKLPIGAYTSLDMGIGISDAVNGTVPGDYESGSPLGLNGNYWASWNSYILSKIEGDITQSNGTKSGFLYHSGVNGMQQLLSFSKDFEIEVGQTTTLTIYVEAKDFFFKTGSEIDMITESATHSGAVGSTDYNLAKRAIENLANAMSMES
ncbi:MAG: Unknown protein [uncultured Aureispira sp.]|uniref:Copper-binding protein MbnP-like domain-containing protein n=1 Tax=uncultured Aureispira sp. TaxID=1331704 RepID=A0A6S6S9A2_9BACT|nr:MAG: Unknown protein [uncultured Aureispira sp.]